MTVDRDLLALCALGLATPDEAAAVEADRRGAAELAELRAVAAELAQALPGATPAPHVRARLLASIGGGPFERFAERFAQLYDLAVDRARELLGWIEDPTRWRAPMPGVRFARFVGGPAYATADCGILRIAPGTAFPWHAHVGDEHSLFLGGTGRDHLGHVYVAGDELVLPAGSAHEFSTTSDIDLVVAVRHTGIDFKAPRSP